MHSAKFYCNTSKYAFVQATLNLFMLCTPVKPYKEPKSALYTFVILKWAEARSTTLSEIYEKLLLIRIFLQEVTRCPKISTNISEIVFTEGLRINEGWRVLVV